MNPTATKEDFDAFIEKCGIDQATIFAYEDSSGEECFVVVDDRLDYGAKIERISRAMRESEELVKEIEEMKKQAS